MGNLTTNNTVLGPVPKHTIKKKKNVVKNRVDKKYHKVIKIIRGCKRLNNKKLLPFVVLLLFLAICCAAAVFIISPLAMWSLYGNKEKRRENIVKGRKQITVYKKHSCTAAVVQRCKSVGFHHLLTNYLPSLSLFTVMTVGSFALLCHHCNVEIPKKRAKLNQAFLRSQSLLVYRF